MKWCECFGKSVRKSCLLERGQAGKRPDKPVKCQGNGAVVKKEGS